MSKIQLNLDNSPFATQLGATERWQRQASDSLVRALLESGDLSQSSAKLGSDNLTIHNAILVLGPRGAGKTVFLKNVQKIWEESAASQAAPRLYFCRDVDPTLLVERDNFANVVIAHLFNEVTDKWEKQGDPPPGIEQDFYAALDKLANALGNTEHSNAGAAGIDRIISYRSGIQLESLFQRFVRTTIRALDVDAIVLPIDDVDMALGRAFDVLDVVRRLLGCPYIIPIVSGDLALYRPIITDHFASGGVAPKSILIDRPSAEGLTDAYLTKLFTVQNRIELLGLSELLPELVVRERDREEPAEEFLDMVARALCPLVNGDEKSRDWPQPGTPREFEQVARMFAPSFLSRKASDVGEFWYRAKVLASGREHGSLELVADAERWLIQQRQADTIPRLLSMDVFNVTAQAHVRPSRGHDKPYFKQLEKALSELPLSPSVLQSHRAFLARLEENPYTRRSLPPLEFFSERLQVPRFRQQIKEVDSRAQVLFSLYCHHAMYGTARRTSAQVYFSRAFELLAVSLLFAKRSSHPELRHNAWENLITELCARPPFHCIHAIAPTKTFSDDDESDADDSTTDSTSRRERESDRLERIGIRALAKEIIAWEEQWAEFLEKMQAKGLVTLLACVFNKVFTQVHLLRVRAIQVFREDFLSDAAARFEYIVVNATATFLRHGAVQQNTALTPNVAPLRDPALYARTDPSFRDNVVRFAGRRGVSLPDTASDGERLVQAVWTHPLFELHRDTVPRFNLRTAPAETDEPGNADADSGRLADRLHVEMPVTKAAIERMNQKEARRLLRLLRSIAAADGTSLEQVYAKRVAGRAKYEALRERAQS